MILSQQCALEEKEEVIQVLAKAYEERLMLINKLDAELVRQCAAEKRRPKIHGETDVALMKGNVSAIYMRSSALSARTL